MTSRFDATAQLAAIDAKMQQLRVQKSSIRLNEDKKTAEFAKDVRPRLEGFRIKQGMREARLDLTGERCSFRYLDPDLPREKLQQQIVKCKEKRVRYKIGKKPLPLAVFELIRDECASQGSPCVAISEPTIAAELGASERHVRRILDNLAAQKMLFRFKRAGVETTYAALLPVSDRYEEELDDALRRWKERLGSRMERIWLSSLAVASEAA